MGKALEYIAWKERLAYKLKDGSLHDIKVTSVVDRDDYCHVIFHSPGLLKKVLDTGATAATVDGTFKTAPWIRACYQILIFSVFSFGKVSA